MTPIAPGLVAAVADRYRIERELGQGGMATVYLAWDLRHDRKVALKVLRPELAATIGPERFLREIRIAAQLQHPHVLPMLESGEADGFLFYVMPFVDGQSLRDRLTREGELPVHEAVKLLVEITDALSYAHAQGVVHRDVKPDNVMVSGRHALVMDFGVAKAVSEASGRNTLTTAGVALGTPAYMAPEQAAADPHVDHRADIYAVGVMAYELLGGRTPFTGGTPQQILAAHVTQAPDPVSKYRPAIPPALEQAIMRCLAKRPADRWQSADELLAQLEPLATPSGGITPTSTRPIEGWKPAGRSRVWFGLAAAALVTVAAAAWMLRPAARPRGLVQLDRTQLTFTGNTRAPSLSPDGKRIAYAARRCDSVGTCLFDVIVQDVGGAGAATIVQNAINVWATEWTGDGRYLLVGASLDDTWGWYSIPVLGGRPRHLGQGDASLLGNGDTTLIVSPLPGDTAAWLRRVGTVDGAVYDSIAIPSAPGALPNVRATSDGHWLVLQLRRGRSASLMIADRTGRLRDSVMFGSNELSRTFPVPNSDAVVAFVRPAEGGDAADALVYRIGRDGLLSRPDTVARQLDVDWASFGAGGQLVIAAGPVEFSVSTVEWEGREGAQFVLRRVAASTSIGVTGSISGDGTQLLLVREVRTGAGVLRQASIMPFDSGAQRDLGPPRALLDWDWGADELVAAERRGDSVGVGVLDPATGRLRTSGWYRAQDYEALETVPGGGYLVEAPAGRLARVGVPGLRDTTFDLAPSVGRIIGMEPSPDGRSVATTVWLPNEDTLGVHVISLADGSVRRVGTFFGEGSETPRWLEDGTLLVVIQETGWTAALYRLTIATGRSVRLGVLPGTPASYRFAADGKRGIVRAADSRPDIYLIRNFRELITAR